MMSLVAYVPDLMDRSRVAEAADSARFVSAPSELVRSAASADLVVLDLSRRGSLDALEEIVGLGIRSIGFCPHAERDLMTEARALGCDQVLARSAFFSQLSELLR